MFNTRKAMTFIASAAVAAILPFAAHAADVGAEITTAATHATLAAQATDLATVHMHLHHTLNCLAGPAGKGFDGKEINPCANSGSGAIPDTTDASKKKALQDAASQAMEGITDSDLASAQKDASATAAKLKAAM